MIVYIYGLVDPRDKRVRYVGKSLTPAKRLEAHLKDKCNLGKALWIEELQKHNLKPEIVILDKGDEHDWQSRERFWIAEYRRKDPELTNILAGGNYGGYVGGQEHECFICRGGANNNDSICRHCDINKDRVEREAREGVEYREKMIELASLEMSKLIFDNMSREILENPFKCKKN